MNRPTREFAPEEAALLKELIQCKTLFRLTRAFVTLTEDIPYGSRPGGNGPWNGDYVKIIPAGTTMRICMVSRMGDFGLNDDLTADHGYGVRLPFDDAAMSNLRKEP